MGRRKFKIGDPVRVTKPGRYARLQGLRGTVVNYEMRVYRGYVHGSHYKVDFGFKVCWIETEYLTEVKD